MINQRDAAKVAHESFSSRFDDFERLVKVFESSGILRRYLVRPLDWGAQAVSAASALGALLAEARPGSCVPVVAVELCSVAFRIDKLTKENIIATALFGDGAACCGQARADWRASRCRGSTAGPERWTAWVGASKTPGWA